MANAPVSYGVFEMTVGTDWFLAPAERVLQEIAQAGYQGIDLGPVGYLGQGDHLRKALAASDLALAGGYIDLPFAEPDRLSSEVSRLDALLDTFDAAGRLPDRPPPRPTLAASRREAHRRHPGAAQHDRSIGFDADGWQMFGDGLRRVVERCRARGYEPTFHHHAATWIEAPWEIERMLELSDVGLCLDTGHLIVGAGDPVALLVKWGARINHIHLKDVRQRLLDQIVEEGAATDEIWPRDIFCPLGEGDLDIEGVLEGLTSVGYEGWLVIEQDVMTSGAARFEKAVADQRSNLRFLKRRGL